MSDAPVDYRQLFARELLRSPDQPFDAALRVFPHDPAMAIQVSASWPFDPEIKAMQQYLLETEGVETYLPTKEQTAAEILAVARASRDNDDKLKAYKLFGDIMGYIEKPQINSNNENNVTYAKVMVISNDDNADWETELREQQARLIEETSNRGVAGNT